MKIRIKNKQYEFDPKYDNLRPKKSGWKRQNTDSFKFEIIGDTEVFIKRFNREYSSIPGIKFLEAILNLKIDGLPTIYDLQSNLEDNREVFYLFQQSLKGNTLEELIAQNTYNFEPYTFSKQLYYALEAITTKGFWFPDFVPKNIFVTNDKQIYLIDLDSVVSIDVLPLSDNHFLSTIGKQYIGAVGTYWYRNIQKVDYMYLSNNLKGDTINYLMLIILLGHLKFSIEHVNNQRFLTLNSIKDIPQYLLKLNDNSTKAIFTYCFRYDGVNSYQKILSFKIFDDYIKKVLFKSENINIDKLLNIEKSKLPTFKNKSTIPISVKKNTHAQITNATPQVINNGSISSSQISQNTPKYILNTPNNDNSTNQSFYFKLFLFLIVSFCLYFVLESKLTRKSQKINNTIVNNNSISNESPSIGANKTFNNLSLPEVKWKKISLNTSYNNGNLNYILKVGFDSYDASEIDCIRNCIKTFVMNLQTMSSIVQIKINNDKKEYVLDDDKIMGWIIYGNYKMDLKQYQSLTGNWSYSYTWDSKFEFKSKQEFEDKNTSTDLSSNEKMKIVNDYYSYISSGDFEGVYDLYAPILDTFFGKTQITRENVILDHKQYYARWKVIGFKQINSEILSKRDVGRFTIKTLLDWNIQNIENGRKKYFQIQSYISLDHENRIISIREIDVSNN